MTNLTLDVPGRRLLDGISFSAAAGECLAIVGPSGSGKTSLLNCVGGIVAPLSGSVRVGEVELTSLRAHKRSTFRLRRVGMVFQFGELLPELSAIENVALPLRFMGVSRSDAERRAAEWLERLGLDGHAGDHPEVLSGGEVQRVAIARALASSPELILADEPTGALDEESTKKVADLLVGTAKELGAAMVVATHDPLVASKVDRALRLRDGQLTATEQRDLPMRSSK